MIKKNDIVEFKIDTIDFPNKGIGFIDGNKIIVKNVLPGQVVSARISKKRNGNLEGKLIDVLEKAPKETIPGCSHFPVCGGCAYQNITIDDENVLKESQVLKLLEQAEVSGFRFEGIVGSPIERGYRNKCEFSFGDEQKGGELALGMRKRNSFYEVVTLKDCNIVDNDYLKIIKYTLEFFKKRNIPFYHKMRHNGILRHLVVRKGSYTGDILINLVTTSQNIFNIQEYKDGVLKLKLKGGICGVLHTINDNVADAVISDDTNIIFGRDYFYDKLLGKTFKISAFSFFQTNTKGAEVLYSIVKSYIGETRDKVVFDLYCGTGTIGLIVAETAKKVIGIEIVEEAVEMAKQNAEINNITNCQFIAGDVLKKIEEIELKPDIMIIDPPREGIHPKTIDKIVDFGAPQIIYISCKASSLSKDLKVFECAGYTVDKVKCINQFPRTTHVECVVLMSRKDG